MSNSIWKKPDQKPERNEDILVEYTSTNGQSYYIVDSYLNELLQPKRWAYLSDIIAQADKAKRLEKENEAMRDEFELWHYNHKCVLEELESARQALKDHSADASKMVGQKENQ